MRERREIALEKREGREGKRKEWKEKKRKGWEKRVGWSDDKTM